MQNWAWHYCLPQCVDQSKVVEMAKNHRKLLNLKISKCYNIFKLKKEREKKYFVMFKYLSLLWFLLLLLLLIILSKRNTNSKTFFFSISQIRLSMSLLSTQIATVKTVTLKENCYIVAKLLKLSHSPKTVKTFTYYQ